MQYLSRVAPKNGIGIIGLSWIDFYPGEGWNHILGEGSASSGCAAVGFGHYAMFSNVGSHSFVSSKGQLCSRIRQVSSQVVHTVSSEMPQR